MKSKRVVVDTNIWISFLISKNENGLFDLIWEEKVVLLFSEESFLEFTKVSQRAKFKKYFTPNDVSILIEKSWQFLRICPYNLGCRDL